MLKRLCVYCGSHPGCQPAYAEAAAQLAHALASRNIALVYGGASVGIMGVLADAMLAAGGAAIGVIPRGLVEREKAHGGLTELRVVETMHERKALMADLADGFIALPGGFGTIEELFEMLTWAQLGLHRKPVGLLNVLGYFDSLLDFLERTVAERFVRPEHLSMLIVDSSHAGLLEKIGQCLADQAAQRTDSVLAR
jgi:hypothetical protein